MNPSCKCPDSAELREILEGDGSDPANAAVISHLDQCPSCQQSLEALASSGDRAFAATLLGQAAYREPEPQSAYWPALHTAEHAILGDTPSFTRSSTELSLNFLNPPTDDTYLGSLGNFQITSVIGRGGMGVVLRAIDTHLQRDVAIKVLDPELSRDELAATRFCREARAAAQISHENVVAVHHVEHDGTTDIPFLVMELVSGESLESRLDRDGRMSLREIVRIGMQTAAGLAAAHDKGLIHRDIKPGNILLEKNGQRVKLTDFGLAQAAEDVRLTRTGLVAGTPLYMSPEQATGDELDARSDLFSLGVVLYELAAGEPPFNGKTPLVVLRKMTEERPRPIRELNPEIPEWFAHIVERLLAKKPSDRYQSAREVADTLEHFWVLLKSSETLICPKKRAAHFWKSVGVGAIAGVATLLVGVFAAFFLMPRSPGTEAIPTPVHVFKGTGSSLWTMALSEDGQHMAIGADDGTVKYWDIPGEKVLFTLNAHKGPVWGLDLSPHG
ncbi:MAG TPA: serine/threonine-protein kinase, partial [Planctomycetaceae bacterium]|nr:serine/threonine-protein kinase [Planctomycetaceae bacterium]